MATSPQAKSEDYWIFRAAQRWCQRHAVALVEFAAAVPWFANNQFTESAAPGATLVEPSVIFSGRRSDDAAIDGSPT
jgi:hypothetical protein